MNRRWAASTCIWQEGNGYSEVEGVGDWEVVLCDLCGGKGSHLGCWESDEATFVCKDCGGNGPELEVRDQSIITIISREDESSQCPGVFLLTIAINYLREGRP